MLNLNLKKAMDLLNKDIYYIKDSLDENNVLKASRKHIEKHYNTSCVIVKSIEPIVKNGVEHTLITIYQPTNIN